MNTVTTLKTPVNSTWNVSNGNGKKKNYTSDASGIHVTYVKHKFASKAGVNFRAQPKGVFPTDTLLLEYDVFFPEDFDFVLGGKLPGMWGGAAGAGGGNWNDEGWSFRVMFREKGEAVAYVYMATDQGKYSGDEQCKLVKNQGNGFDDIAHHTNGAGIDLWRDQGLKFKKGQWNSVSLLAKCNSPGKADGMVSLIVNGETKIFKNIQWSEKKMKIAGLAFTTWFGGGSRRYAPSKTQKASFKNIRLTT